MESRIILETYKTAKTGERKRAGWVYLDEFPEYVELKHIEGDIKRQYGPGRYRLRDVNAFNKPVLDELAVSALTIPRTIEQKTTYRGTETPEKEVKTMNLEQISALIGQLRPIVQGAVREVVREELEKTIIPLLENIGERIDDIDGEPGTPENWQDELAKFMGTIQNVKNLQGGQ